MPKVMFYFQRVEMYAFQFISFNNHLLSTTMFKALVSECAIIQREIKSARTSFTKRFNLSD